MTTNICIIDEINNIIKEEIIEDNLIGVFAAMCNRDKDNI